MYIISSSSQSHALTDPSMPADTGMTYKRKPFFIKMKKRFVGRKQGFYSYEYFVVKFAPNISITDGHIFFLNVLRMYVYITDMHFKLK